MKYSWKRLFRVGPPLDTTIHLMKKEKWLISKVTASTYMDAVVTSLPFMDTTKTC